MRNLIVCLSLCLLTFQLSVQNKFDRFHTPEDLIGYWTGALISNGSSIQSLAVEFLKTGDSILVLSSIPDWTYYPPKASGLIHTSDSIGFTSYYGDLMFSVDSIYSELIGKLRGSDMDLKVHLKRSLKAPEIGLDEKEITIENEGAKISGTLYYPKLRDGKLSCAILVHGRGCRDRRNKSFQARLFAKFGMASFVYDKRGSEASGYPCGKATHDQNVSDVLTIVERLSQDELIDANKIGLISYSAGGWIIPHVAQKSKTPIAFLITNVGPTTSVLEQQIDGLEAFMKNEGMSQKAIEEGKRYTHLLFSEDNYKAVYEELLELLKAAEKSGWDKWLEADDYVAQPDSFSNLWVQRFSYDPANALMDYKGPMLAIYGSDDFVVPYQKQIERLNDLKGSPENGNYQYVVIPKANHGLEQGPAIRKLKEGESYYKFDRVGYGVIQYPVDFLRKHGFIEVH